MERGVLVIMSFNVYVHDAFGETDSCVSDQMVGGGRLSRLAR